jgi:hypothetical protein
MSSCPALLDFDPRSEMVLRCRYDSGHDGSHMPGHWDDATDEELRLLRRAG